MEAHHYMKSIATLLTAIALIFYIGSPAAARPAPASATNTEFIRRSCSSTTYPTLCFSSLSSHASAIQQDPKLLADTALSVSLDTTRATSAEIIKLAHSTGLTPRDASAMRDCVEELSDSVDQLRKSMAEMRQIRSGSNFGMLMSDIQTWVSAALTNEDTCVEGFTGKTRMAVRGRILNVVHTTSNALALINSYAALHGR